MGKTPCCNAEDLKKGAWTSDEDQKLIAHIQEHGEGGWRTLPQKAGLRRCGKSCRLRWVNYLRPDIKRGEFSSEEEQKIIELHATLGNRWAAIARHLTRRTDNEIKNHWNTHLKKRLTNMGVDPVTHNPIAPSLGSSNNTNNNESNNTASHSSQYQSAQPNSSRPSSALAHLLNHKSTPKLASSQCLDAIKHAQAHQSISKESDDSNGDNDAVDINVSNVESPRPSLVLGSLENPLTMQQRPVSTSARLLNKMASRLTAPLHCFDTLKSILSKSSIELGPGDHVTPTSTGVVNEPGSNHASPDHSFDLDFLKDWQLEVSTDTIEGGFDGSGDGGVSSTSIGNTNNIEPCMSPLNFMKSTSTFSTCGSFESLEFLGMHGDNKTLAAYADLDMEPINTEDDDQLMEGISNFIVSDSTCEHIISTSTRDSENGGESEGGA